MAQVALGRARRYMIVRAPEKFVRAFSWGSLAELSLGSLAFLGLAGAVFHAGLKRYESGSGIQVEV